MISKFNCGPFAEVVKNMEDFGTALYFSQLYYETIQQHQDLVIKLEEARNSDDQDVIDELEKQIYFIESICSIENFTEFPSTEN